MSHIEGFVRRRLCTALNRRPEKAELLNLDEDLSFGYGLSSLDLIMLMSSLCNDAKVPLTELTEEDIGALRTPSDIVSLLVSKSPQ